MLRDTIAGVGFCKLLHARIVRSNSRTFRPGTQILKITFLIERNAASFRITADLLPAIKSSKALRFTAPYLEER